MDIESAPRNHILTESIEVGNNYSEEDWILGEEINRDCEYDPDYSYMEGGEEYEAFWDF